MSYTFLIKVVLVPGSVTVSTESPLVTFKLAVPRCGSSPSEVGGKHLGSSSGSQTYLGGLLSVVRSAGSFIIFLSVTASSLA